MQTFIASAGDTHPDGIHHVELDTASGAMRHTGSTPGLTDCLYLALHPTQPLLYAVGEGHIAAFRRTPEGDLSLINRQPAYGHEPCYVSVTQRGDFALVSNYAGPRGTGSIGVFPLQADGGVAPVAHHFPAPGAGAGVHPTRQDAPHPHMITTTPDGAFVLVPDLGTDRVLVYTLDHETGRLALHEGGHVAIQAGSGPRHLIFHPTQPVFYVLSELTPVLSVVTYDAAGRFAVVATYPTLPPGETMPDNNLGADIRITPSGRFLYATNRGHNSLAAFAVSDDGRTLDYLGHQSTLGDWPRGFGIAPAGDLLIAANQHSDDLHSFHIDAATGQLQATGHSLSVPAPVCVAFDPGTDRP